MSETTEPKSKFTFPKPTEKQRRNVKLTPRAKAVIAEYVRTGLKGRSYRIAYTGKPENVSINANKFFKRPKVIDALEKALKEARFDEQYAVTTLKKIVEGGMANIDITRPDTSLKALETYFKLTNKIGGGNKITPQVDVEGAAKKMDLVELQSQLKELDKKQKRILDVMKGVKVDSYEGEVIK